MIRISDFRLKEVINITDGKRLGSVQDIDIDIQTGKINGITLVKTQKLLGFFGKDEDIEIPWNQIVKIGQDVILIRLTPVYEGEEFSYLNKRT